MSDSDSKSRIKELMKSVWGIELDDQEVQQLIDLIAKDKHRKLGPRMDLNKLPCKRGFHARKHS